MNKMDTILCIWDRMGDYHRARITALKKIYPRTITADLGTSDQLYKWKSEKKKTHFLLSDKNVDEVDFFNRISRFKLLLKQEDVQAIAIAGYGKLEYLGMMLVARLKGKKVIVFVESWYSRGFIRDWLKGGLIKILAHKYFASGVRAEKHLISKLSIRRNTIEKGYSAIDNEHFAAENVDYSVNTLLCVARFSPEKNLPSLIQNFKKSNLSKSWVLQIVGGGPLESELKSMAVGNHNINILSWKDYQDLPKVYQNASSFILPSLFEPWGLVVNEAMASGLPILLSEQCGCLPDLVDQKNGITFNAEKEDSMLLALNQWSQLTEQDLKTMGEASSSRIASFSTETWASTLQKLIHED